MDCIFCKIVKGEIPCYKIYEDDYVLAFLDIKPDSNGHTLIIPKKHYKDIDSIDEYTYIKVFESAKRIKQLLTEKLNIDGLTLIQNNGLIQEVKHFHLHLKPYYKLSNKIISVETIFNKLDK